MASFEQVGQRIDRELKKLRRFFEAELKPTAERKAIKALRNASRRLAKLAEDLETRGARARK